MITRIAVPALGLALALALGGCDGEQDNVSPPLSAEELRARTEFTFPSVDMYKPVVAEGSGLDTYQAPMFYREHPEGQPSIDQDFEFAGLVLEGGKLALDPQRPAVYTQGGRALHGAIEHEQRTFLWFHRDGGQGPIRAQGIRLTYDSQGFPAIFEVLKDASGKSLYYVSESLEALAREQHGDALEGRVHAIEPSVSESPDSLVVRPVKQGVQPLGPLIYDGVQGTDILQLHCRCAPSQLEAIGASVNYDLIPIESLGEELRAALVKELDWGASPQDLGFPAPIWPFASLRMPEAF